MNNRLRQAIEEKLAKKNEGIPKRLKKWSRTQELHWLADEMSVSYVTAYLWFHNKSQPSSFRMHQLAGLYKQRFGTFYYKKVKVKKISLQVR